MSDVVNLSEARENLPELADRANAGETHILARRGRELAVLIGIDEYHRLIAIEALEKEKDFSVLLGPPESGTMAEDAAQALAVRMVREHRANYPGR